MRTMELARIRDLTYKVDELPIPADKLQSVKQTNCQRYVQMIHEACGLSLPSESFLSKESFQSTEWNMVVLAPAGRGLSVNEVIFYARKGDIIYTERLLRKDGTSLPPNRPRTERWQERLHVGIVVFDHVDNANGYHDGPALEHLIAFTTHYNPIAIKRSGLAEAPYFDVYLSHVRDQLAAKYPNKFPQ